MKNMYIILISVKPLFAGVAIHRAEKISIPKALKKSDYSKRRKVMS